MSAKQTQQRRIPSEGGSAALAKEFGISACGPLPSERQGATERGSGRAASRRRGRRTPLGLILIASAVGVILGRSL